MRARAAKLLLGVCLVAITAVLLAWAASYGTFRFTTHDGRFIALVAPDLDGHQHLMKLAEQQDSHETIVQLLRWSKPDWERVGFDYRSCTAPTTYNPTKQGYDTVVLKVISIPLWAPALLLLMPTLLLLGYLRRLRRRVTDGKCLHCGYDLRGIASDRCPECGQLAPDRPAADGAAAERARPDRPIPQPRLQ